MILSAGIVPVFFEDNAKKKQPLFLLLRAYKYWDFPKGLVENGENAIETAVRELQEETGLMNPKFTWGDDYIETAPYSNRKIARYYIAEVDSMAVKLTRNPVSGIVEHHEWRFCTFDEANVLLGERVKKILEWANTLVR